MGDVRGVQVDDGGARRRPVLGSPVLIPGAIAGLIVAFHATRMLTHGAGRIDDDDFHFYWQAARRFLAAPTSLYGGFASADLRTFLYPPPSILLFVPLAAVPQAAAAWLFRAISLAAVPVSVYLLASIFTDSGLAVRRWERRLLVLVALAAGPTYTNLVYGQVNTLVLLDCLAFRWLLDRQRPILAGVVLALGGWLKIYPLGCLLWVALWERRHTDVRRALAGFGAAFVLIPLLSLPMVPPSLYQVYVSQVLPATTSRTFQNILNQSFLGAVARGAGPIADFVGWERCNFSVVPPAWARVANGCLALGSFIALGLWSRSTRAARRLIGYLCLLSMFPIVSPLGWAYVYVMALPALLLALLQAPIGVPRAIVLGAWVSYTVQASHEVKFIAHLPQLLGHFFYDRYLVTAALVCGLLVWMETVEAGRHSSAPKDSVELNGIEPSASSMPFRGEVKKNQ